MTTKLFCDNQVKLTIYKDVSWHNLERRAKWERQYWKYRLYWKGQLVFKGNDFLGPMHMKVNDAVYSLLNFLTLQPGDTDADYFSNYTELQRDFMYSAECEELRMMLYDLENERII